MIFDIIFIPRYNLTMNFKYFLLFILILNNNTRCSALEKNLNDPLKQYQVEFNIVEPLYLINNLKYPARNRVFHTIVAENKNYHIEMEIISPFPDKEFEHYSKTKYKIITNLYGPQLIPYTGELTTTTDCPKEKKPEEIIIKIMKQPTKVLLANATNRYTLGVWEDDLIKTKAAFTIVYDKEKEVIYQIIVFQKIESFNKQNILNIFKNFKNIY